MVAAREGRAQAKLEFTRRDGSLTAAQRVTRRLQNRFSAICARARNSYSREQLAQDFR